MRQNQAIFANFICKFGDKNMIDYLEEIILPAFTDDKLNRRHGETIMHFSNVEIFMDNDTPILAGKFIYNTMLHRTHIYRADVGQIESHSSMESAPSSFFVLFLDNHRMIYFAETRDAPNIDRFEKTVQKFIDLKRDEYIRKESSRSKEVGLKVTIKKLGEIVPRAELNIVPVSSSESVEEFISRYDKIQSLKIIVLKRNKDLDPSKTMDELEQIGKLTSADNVGVSISNGDGLDAAGVSSLIVDVNQGGNQQIAVKGIDLDGAALVGNNEDFSFRPEYEHVPHSTKNRARFLFKEFKKLVTNKKLWMPAGDEKAKAKATNLISRQ